MKIRTAIGLCMFVLGVFSLGSVLYLRSTIDAMVINTVSLDWEGSLLRPKVSCTVAGINPLPFAVDVLQYHLRVGEAQLPVALSLKSARGFSFAPGEFQMTTELVGENRLDATLTSGGISWGILKGIKYRGELLVSLLGLAERKVRFNGTIEVL